MAAIDHADAELPAAIRHAGDGLAGITNRVQELHEAIAGRAFGYAPMSSPARRTHDLIAGAVYSAVRGSLRAAAGGAARLAQRSGGGPSLTENQRGSMAQSALCALIGDRLAHEHSPLAVHMAVRSDHRDVPLVTGILAEEFPDATDHPVLLVHGLGEQEDAWSLGRRNAGGTYADRVITPIGGSPVRVRYNTGLPLAENGRRLSRLIGLLVERWPVEVRHVSIVGHSMGGLVGRSAIAHGRADGQAWVDLLHTIVTLGSPHGGAPLARAAGAAALGLDLLPEGRAVASVLHTRSAGIGDLEHGCFALPGTGSADAAGRATHHAVSATLSRDPEHPVGRLLGDLLVMPGSAHGRLRGAPVAGFVADTLHHVGGANHFTLLNTPRLDGALRRWLDPGVNTLMPPDPGAI